MNETIREASKSDAQLQADLNILRGSANRRLAGTAITLTLCCTLGVWASSTQNRGGDVPPVIIGAILLLFAGVIAMFVLYARKSREIKAYVGQNVTRGLLDEVFEIAEYDHTGCISEDLLRSAALTPAWDRCSGSDLVRGSYKGRSILFSDVKLEEIEQQKNPDGETETEWHTIFQGPWIFIENDRKLPAPVRVREKPPILGRHMKSDLETENAAFNERFQILAQDGHAAFLVLTPRFMEFISSANAMAGGLISLCFDGNYTCVAIYNDSDLFEPSGKKLKDLEALKAEQRGEIRYITGILDELLQNADLFAERTGDEAAPAESDPQGAFAFESSAEAAQRESGAPTAKKAGLLRRLNPVGLVVLAAYLASAVFALIALPYGITLSTDIWSPDALTVPTPIYLAVLTVFVLGFLQPLLKFKMGGRNRSLLVSIAGTALLLLFHILFVAANLAG